MNIEEIRKNAPDGATHYCIYDEICFYKNQDCGWFFWKLNKWLKIPKRWCYNPITNIDNELKPLH
jgi:hypothetical protein